MSKFQSGKIFIGTSLLALALGVFMGCLAALQFVVPGFFEILPFFKSRPLHVSLVISWIFMCAIGGVYYYLPRYHNLPLFSPKLVAVHYWIFVGTGLAILGSYVAGRFGGREYWEFPPILAIPIIVSWVLFAVNYFKTVFRKKGKWPVYLWMWGTGIFFFLYTFLEANLWVFSYFGDNIVREIPFNGRLMEPWWVHGICWFMVPPSFLWNALAAIPKLGPPKWHMHSSF